MDIFTTVLTRVVPVPIKPASLKVKALLKEAGASKLKEDPDHLENHDYYFADCKLNNEEHEQTKGSEKNTVETNAEPSTNENQNEETNKEVSVSKDGVKHLDLYV